MKFKQKKLQEKKDNVLQQLSHPFKNPRKNFSFFVLDSTCKTVNIVTTIYPWEKDMFSEAYITKNMKKAEIQTMEIEKLTLK